MTRSYKDRRFGNCTNTGIVFSISTQNKYNSNSLSKLCSFRRQGRHRARIAPLFTLPCVRRKLLLLLSLQ